MKRKHSKNETQEIINLGSNEPNFKAIFESLPGRYLILTPDLMIVAASNAYLTVTKAIREDIIFKHVFEVFPEKPDDLNADGVRNLRASLNIVLETLTSHTMALQGNDIQRSGSET